MSSLFTIARAYAHAVFDVSIEQKNVEQWKLVLELFVRVSSYDLVRSLFFKSLESEKLSNVFIAICEDFQKKQIDISAANFIRVISEKNRLTLLPLIFEEFNYLYYMYYKYILKIEVISAWPLSDDQVRKISSIMARRFSRKIDVVNKINKNIFSGIIIRIGDFIIDGSIYSRILRLNNYILQS